MKTTAQGASSRPDRRARPAAILGIAAALVATAYLIHGGEVPAPAQAMPASSLTARAGDVDVAALRDEVVRLRTSLAALEARTASATPPSPPAGHGDQPSREERAARNAERAERQTQAIERAFAQERQDPAWGPQLEHHLRDGFGKAALAGAHLDEASCGATLCRLRLRFDSMAVRSDGVAGAMALVGWDSEILAQADPADPLQFVIYATRAPGQFPTVD